MAFTGHRPEKLPWGRDEEDVRCQALKIQLGRAVRRGLESGVEIFACGMARGCDFYFAEAVLALRDGGCRLELEAYLPCPSQPDRWPQADRQRYARLLERCDRVILVEPEYSRGCMLRRNREMLRHADKLLTVWDGSPGGTQAAVRWGQYLGLEITALWL